jgi:hypothetical protein
MVRSAAEQRVSKHVAAPSFETRPSKSALADLGAKSADVAGRSSG